MRLFGLCTRNAAILGGTRLLLLTLCLAGVMHIGRGAVVPAKAVAAQLLLERAFDAGVRYHTAVKPWPWADTRAIARLRVQRLGAERIVLDGGSGQAMAFGPTLLPAASRPGRPGTSIMAAHRDTHFAFLQNIHAGDVITVETLDARTIRYRVTGAHVARWDDYAARRYGEEQLDLVTCYPFGTTERGPLRYIVTSERL